MSGVRVGDGDGDEALSRRPSGLSPNIMGQRGSFNHSESPDPILTLGFQKRQLGLTVDSEPSFPRAYTTRFHATVHAGQRRPGGAASPGGVIRG